jgi:hypothetical protein
MTEDEAKTKWCPFVRTPMKIRDNFYVANQVTIDGQTDGPKCIGSACMAWRFRQVGEPTDGINAPYTHHGFCGLAGKP